jgi:hypothetical protein
MNNKQSAIQENLKSFLSQGPVEISFIIDYCSKKDISSRRSLYKARNEMKLETVVINDKGH